MSTQIPTLHGSIPGLLRRGSPVFWRDEETPYVATWIGPWPDSKATEDDDRIALVAPSTEPCLGMCVNASADLALDLSDATGRCHAAWWLADRVDDWLGLDRDVVTLAERGIEMTPEQVEALRAMCLRASTEAS